MLMLNWDIACMSTLGFLRKLWGEMPANCEKNPSDQCMCTKLVSMCLENTCVYLFAVHESFANVKPSLKAKITHETFTRMGDPPAALISWCHILAVVCSHGQREGDEDELWELHTPLPPGMFSTAASDVWALSPGRLTAVRWGSGNCCSPKNK